MVVNCICIDDPSKSIIEKLNLEENFTHLIARLKEKTKKDNDRDWG